MALFIFGSVATGIDVTLVSTGIMACECLRAAELLEADRISARVLHYPTVKPLEIAPLIAAARETAGIVTAEEHSIYGGLGEAVAGAVAETYPCRVLRIGVRDVFGESGQAGELLDKFKLRGRDIADAARELLGARPCA